MPQTLHGFDLRGQVHVVASEALRGGGSKPGGKNWCGWNGIFSGSIFVWFYTTQYIGDYDIYNNPIGESLLTKQYNGMTEGF